MHEDLSLDPQTPMKSYTDICNSSAWEPRQADSCCSLGNLAESVKPQFSTRSYLQTNACMNTHEHAPHVACPSYSESYYIYIITCQLQHLQQALACIRCSVNPCRMNKSLIGSLLVTVEFCQLIIHITRIYKAPPVY